MERTFPEMLNQMTPGANPVLVDISSTDFDVPAGKVVKGISSITGTVIYVNITDEYGNDVDAVPIPAGWFGVRGVTKVLKTDTDATEIVLWCD